MKTIRLIMAAAVTALMAMPAAAQTQDTTLPIQEPERASGFSDIINEVEGTVGIDFVSTYMWRGTEKGNVTILPYGRLSWRGAFVQLQGATGFDKDDAKEINLSLGYKYNFDNKLSLNVGLTDYWTSGMDLEGHDVYFEWDPESNGHQLEFNVGLDLRYLQLQAYTMIWGNDFRYETYSDSQNRVNGTRAYSTFIEARVPFYWRGIDWDLCAGITPFKSACSISSSEENGLTVMHKNHFYANKPALVMASIRATKRFEIGDVKVPVFAELHTNPYMKRANILVGVSVIPF